MAAMDESRLAIDCGPAADAYGHEQSADLLGLAGAFVLIVCAIALPPLVGELPG